MNRWFGFGLRYLKYLLRAQSNLGIHSPFVYRFVTEILHNKTPYYIYQPIEDYRKKLEYDSRKIEVVDYGAGSKYMRGKKRNIGEITRHSVKQTKYAQLLFRLVQEFKPKTQLELGTCLGITTIYLSFGNNFSKIYTVEGDASLTEIAGENFKIFKRQNITLINQEFVTAIPAVLSQTDTLDFAFIDGHHKEEATRSYFDQLAVKSSSSSIFILDDIHWSTGMEKAWEAIKQNEKVTLTIDLFEMGLVFFSKRQQKEHFVIRF